MTRYIDADALIESMTKFSNATGEDMTHGIFYAHIAPTIDAEPVRHGNWRFVNCATGLRCQCSECLHWVDAGTDRNHCPNCGADMRGEE